MSLRHPESSAGCHRLMRMPMAVAAVLFILALGIPDAGAGTGGNTDEDAQIVTDAKRVEIAIVAAYNEKKWDALRPLFAEDALLLPPNHEPVQGPDAIIEFYKSARDVVGEINDGWKFLRVKGSGKFASLVGLITIGSGRIPMWYTDLYERQSDGSVRMAVNAFAFTKGPAG